MTTGRDLPWLQDVDQNNNNVSDVWYDQWGIVYRDVVIVDSDDVWRGAFNLTANDLGNTENFALLKSTAVDIADKNPIWQNDSNPMDVNNDSSISPVGDILTCINELNNREYSDASGNLPIPASGNHPFVDVNGDYLISPVGDVLALINYLNDNPSGEGEGSVSEAQQGISIGTGFVLSAASDADLSDHRTDSVPDLWASGSNPVREPIFVDADSATPDTVQVGDDDDDGLLTDLAADIASAWGEL